MTAGTAVIGLEELYQHYKQLALAAGAALLLDVPREPLELEAAKLVGDARAAVESADAYVPQLQACLAAVVELHDLLLRGGGDVQVVRESHKQFRREVWKVIPCEYVPCCASAGHEHE